MNGVSDSDTVLTFRRNKAAKTLGGRALHVVGRTSKQKRCNPRTARRTPTRTAHAKRRRRIGLCVLLSFYYGTSLLKGSCSMQCRLAADFDAGRELPSPTAPGGTRTPYRRIRNTSSADAPISPNLVDPERGFHFVAFFAAARFPCAFLVFFVPRCPPIAWPRLPPACPRTSPGVEPNSSPLRGRWPSRPGPG